MTSSNDEKFNHYYEFHVKHLKLKGLQPKAIEAYSLLGDNLNEPPCAGPHGGWCGEG